MNVARMASWVALLTPMSVSAVSQPVPADFRVYARFVSGDVILMEGKVWEITLTGDGSVSQKTKALAGDKSRVVKQHLATAKVLQLFDAIERYSFFGLPARYESELTDCPPLILSVTARGRSHKVVFQPCMRTEPSARRFERIWEAVLRALAPSELPKKI